jgi:hypothetical protein
MPTVQLFQPADSHQFQYSDGVAAEPARFARPLPLAEGFDAIEAYLARIGRSPTAFCACEKHLALRANRKIEPLHAFESSNAIFA